MKMTKEEVASYHANYYRNNKDKWKPNTRTSAVRRADGQKLKNLVFSHYGTVCQCCGESRLVFLALDHIHNNGKEDRKITGLGQNLYRWLKLNNYPDGYQVLCHNCNWAKRDGICPHKIENVIDLKG
jgi:hypothetical protein